MKTTVEQLIAERSYSSLNEAEKQAVSELCENEQEFNQMKQFFLSMNTIAAVPQFEPSASLKSSLDSVFAAKHGGIGARLTPREPVSTPVAAKIIPLYQQTWARVAAGVLLIAGVASIWQLSGNTTIEGEQKQQLAKAEAAQSEKNEETTAYTAPNVVNDESVAPEEEIAAGSVKEQTLESVFAEEKKAELGVKNTAAADVLTPSYSGYAEDLSTMKNDASFSSVAYNKVKTGREADLYPDGLKDAEKKSSLNASAVTASQEDLLSYIVPAF